MLESIDCMPWDWKTSLLLGRGNRKDILMGAHSYLRAEAVALNDL
jgi:hypothetical protein